MLEHAFIALGDRSLDLARFAAGDSLFLRELATVGYLSEICALDGDPQPSASAAQSYYSFLSSFLPAARAFSSLQWHLPRLLRGIELHAATWCGLDLAIELSPGPEATECAEFCHALVRSLVQGEKRLAGAVASLAHGPQRFPLNNPFPLRVVFETEPKFAGL
jgi:hypothetical protein